MIRTYVELTKPRIVELLLITTIPAMVVAADGWPEFGAVIAAFIGGSLAAGGANVINQVYDRDIDVVMQRTSGRPLPTDRVGPRAATVFGLALGAAGFIVLWLGTTLLAAVLSSVAFGFYVLVYTMALKRSTTQNIVLGGAAGAVPALIGWAAVTGSLALPAWLMFAIIFFWTPPHFWALSLKYRDDYREASVPMLSVVAGTEATHALMLWYSLVTVGVSLALVPVSSLGYVYAVTALASGIGLGVLAWRVRGGAFAPMRYFGFTNVYLAIVFLSMMIDRGVDAPDPGASTLWLAVAAVLVAVGLIGVVSVERQPHMRAPGISPVRHGIEVAITVVFAISMIAASVLAVA